MLKVLMGELIFSIQQKKTHLWPVLICRITYKDFSALTYDLNAVGVYCSASVFSSGNWTAFLCLLRVRTKLLALPLLDRLD